MILNPRTTKFLDNYHASFNIVESYRSSGNRAGEGEDIATAAGKILATIEAREYLLSLSSDKDSPSEATQGAAIVEQLRSIALSNITDVCSWDATGTVGFKPAAQLDKKTQSAIETVRIENTQFGPKIMVKMHSKQAALMTLAKYYNVDCNLNELLDRVRSYDYDPIDVSGENDDTEDD